MTKQNEPQVMAPDTFAADDASTAGKPWQAPVLRTYTIEESTQTLISGAVADGVPGFFADS